MRFYWFVLGVLGTWRVTHLLQSENGPWNILTCLRFRLRQSLWGEVMECFYCLSVWTALPTALVIGESWGESLLLWSALSGGAILLERVTKREPMHASFIEDEFPPGLPTGEERNDVMLRTPQKPDRNAEIEQIEDAK